MQHIADSAIITRAIGAPRNIASSLTDMVFLALNSVTDLKAVVEADDTLGTAVKFIGFMLNFKLLS